MAGRKLLCFVAMALVILGLSGCLIFSERAWEYRIAGLPHTEVALAFDSPDVRKLLVDEDAREDELGTFWRGKHTQERPPNESRI